MGESDGSAKMTRLRVCGALTQCLGWTSDTGGTLSTSAVSRTEVFATIPALVMLCCYGQGRGFSCATGCGRDHHACIAVHGLRPDCKSRATFTGGNSYARWDCCDG